MEKASIGRSWFGQKNGQTGRSSDLVQKMFETCEAKNAAEIDELLQAGGSRHQRVWQIVKADPGPGGWQGSGQRCEKLED